MTDIQIDKAVASRFISSLSKSLQALCHGCMDFDSGIEIVGYINVNIDSSSKVDYVLNEKVQKGVNNSMTFVSNSFLAKKDHCKQTRDGACSPVQELQTFPTPGHHLPHQYNRYPYSSQSRVLHGAQKRSWSGGVDRDWRAKKRLRGGRSSYPQIPTHSRNPNTSVPSLPQSQSADPNRPFDSVNIKSEIGESGGDGSDNVGPEDASSRVKPDPDQAVGQEEGGVEDTTSTTTTGAQGENDNRGGNLLDNNQPADTDAADESSHGAGCGYHEGDYPSVSFGQDPVNSDNNGAMEGAPPQQQQHQHMGGGGDDGSEMPAASGEYNEADSRHGYLPGSSSYEQAGGGEDDVSGGAGFDVIEIDDEDEDVAAMFGDGRGGDSNTKPAQAVFGPTQPAFPQIYPNTTTWQLSTAIPKPQQQQQQHWPLLHQGQGLSQRQTPAVSYHQQQPGSSGSREFRCCVCDVPLKHKNNMKRHLSSVHGLKQCQYCQALIQQGDEFNAHVLRCDGTHHRGMKAS